MGEGRGLRKPEPKPRDCCFLDSQCSGLPGIFTECVLKSGLGGGVGADVVLLTAACPMGVHIPGCFLPNLGLD